jgi:PAS domain S-box-containing protein
VTDLSTATPDRPFQSLAEEAPVMIWMSGLDMGCFYFNRAWLDYRGRTLAEEEGNGWVEGVHPDDLDTCVSHYVSCFESRTPFAMNYRLKDANGRFQWILDRGAPHYSVNGAFLGYFGGCATTEKHSPAQLNRRLRVDLEQVADFARNLALARLRFETDDADSQLVAAAVESGPGGRHAVAQMEKLTTDMLACRGIPPGARWR